MDLESKDKLKVPKKCVDGEHVFVPGTWKISQTTKTCTLFVCQYCLMSVDKRDVEVMGEEHKKRLEKKKEKEDKNQAESEPKA